MTVAEYVFKNPRIRNAYLRWVVKAELLDLDDRRRDFERGWVAGAAEVLRTSAEVGNVVPTISEFVTYLRADRDMDE